MASPHCLAFREHELPPWSRVEAVALGEPRASGIEARSLHAVEATARLRRGDDLRSSRHSDSPGVTS